MSQGRVIDFDESTPSKRARSDEIMSSADALAAQAQRLSSVRRALPIYAARDTIIDTIRQSDSVIIVGETGSGKTTQIPQYLLEAGLVSANAMVGTTQPRRVAAITVARRVAEERGCALGQEVGYCIRFDDTTSDATRLKFLTDGMLLRESMLDAHLDRYDVIILDEAHERSINTDVLFAILKGVQKRRNEAFAAWKAAQAAPAASAEAPVKGKFKAPPPGSSNLKSKSKSTTPRPLKIVVMSATLSAEQFSRYYGDCPIVRISGRCHPVEVFYCAQKQDDIIDSVLAAILQLHIQLPCESTDDILVFLTGEDEIESLNSLLVDKHSKLPAGAPPYIVTPLYAALPQHEQLKAFEPAPHGTRKLILSTNIAETSVTINGVRYVIDTGLVKKRIFVARSGIDCLTTVGISKAEAWQRCGRAGRERPGECYRLYTEPDFEKLDEHATPDILRSNLASVVLQLLALGVKDVLGFDFMDRPPLQSIERALQVLHQLGCLQDEDGHAALTKLGWRMTEFPLDPILGRVVVAAGDRGRHCLGAVCGVAAMLSTQSIFFMPRQSTLQQAAAIARGRFTSVHGDHMTYFNVWRAFDEVNHSKIEDATGKKKPSQLLSHKQRERERRWCEENFVNYRSMSNARDVRHQLISLYESASRRSQTAESDPSTDLQASGSGERVEAENSEIIRKCFLAGFFLQAAQRQADGSYLTLSDRQTVYIHPSSALHRRSPTCVFYHELVATSKQYLRDVSAVEERWLADVAPRSYRQLANLQSAPKQ